VKSRSATPASLTLVVPLLLCAAANLAPYTSHAQLDSSPNQRPTAGELRFPVAYLHGGSWCYGLLYGSDDKVRFEVVQPQPAKSYSFEAPRAEIAIRQWVLLGTPPDAIELKTGGKTYHMRSLANSTKLLPGAPTAGLLRARCLPKL
jgi:hypothetical protein